MLWSQQQGRPRKRTGGKWIFWFCLNAWQDLLSAAHKQAAYHRLCSLVQQGLAWKEKGVQTKIEGQHLQLTLCSSGSDMLLA